MRKTRLFLICLGLLPGLAAADDLQMIYQLAVQHDPVYRAAESMYLAEQQKRPQAWAPLLPQIDVSATHSEISQDTISAQSPAATLGSKDFNTDNYQITLQQVIYRHELYVGLRKAKADVLKAEADYRNGKQDLIIRVASSYFTVLGAVDNLSFARAEREAIEQQLNQAKQRFNVGLTAITDVHEAQARYDQAVAQEIAAENTLAVNRESLRAITGQAHATLDPLNETAPLLNPEPQDIEQWVQTALRQNLSLMAAEKTMESARHTVDQARAGHYPTLGLQASRSKNNNDDPLFGRETEETALSLQLSIPIYEGGRVSSVTREAAYRYQQSKELYELQRRTTENDVRNAYLSALSNISQVKALKQALRSTQTALEATRAGFEVGTRTAVDVLDSQREVFRAKRDYARSRYDYIIQTLRLKSASGTLNDTDVTQVNRWLQ